MIHLGASMFGGRWLGKQAESNRALIGALGRGEAVVSMAPNEKAARYAFASMCAAIRRSKVVAIEYTDETRRVIVTDTGGRRGRVEFRVKGPTLGGGKFFR